MDPKRLVVIDGYSLLYRAFFATRYLSTSDGRPTNALYGFVSMMFLLLEKIKPHAIVVALDAPGKTFRHAEVETYKATRKETQDELKVQLKEARELINTLGVPTIEVVGYEADDVVGTISKLAEANGYHTTIVTGDNDSLQLVDDCVSVMTMRVGVTDTVTYTAKEVTERYGFGPEYLPDFKALKGDSSDNIQGVPGIGDKSGAELIQRFGTIEQIIEHMEEVEPKYRKKLEGLEAQMLQSKFLATIVRDVDLVYDFKPFTLNQTQMEAAIALMESYEFRNHVRRAPVVLGMYLDGRSPSQTEKLVEVSDEALEVTLKPVGNYAELSHFVGDRPYSVFFATVSAQEGLFDEPTRKAFVAVGKEVRETSEADGLWLIQDKSENAILHDSKPAYKRIGERIPAPRFDTLLAAFVLRSERSNYPLRDLVQGYLDFAPPETPQQMAAALSLLERPLRERLDKEHQTRVLEEIELPLIPILSEMENLGIMASREGLAQFSQELQVAIAETTAQVHELCGEEFNIGSPKQLGFILFEKMQIQGGQKTKTGWATGAE
ncbi:MAG TPA: DNA polymerase, partial [Fimbriimonas sp.]|nr:DNA polymerase [Fimbriimonas sp.]